VASAIDLIVHLERTSDGSRRVARVVEVLVSDDGPVLRDTGEGS